MTLSEPGVARVRGYLFVLDRSIPTSLGFKWDTAELPAGGNWVIVIGVGVGLTFLVFTHLGARAFLAWYRQRRTPEFPLAT